MLSFVMSLILQVLNLFWKTYWRNNDPRLLDTIFASDVGSVNITIE